MLDQRGPFNRSWQTAHWHGKTLARDLGMFDANYVDVETDGDAMTITMAVPVAPDGAR